MSGTIPADHRWEDKAERISSPSCNCDMCVAVRRGQIEDPTVQAVDPKELRDLYVKIRTHEEVIAQLTQEKMEFHKKLGAALDGLMGIKDEVRIAVRIGRGMLTLNKCRRDPRINFQSMAFLEGEDEDFKEQEI